MNLPRCLLILASACALGAATQENEFALAARSLDEMIAANYAYLDKLPGGTLPQSNELQTQRANVQDARALLAYAEARIASLADHHAITGSSFGNSWAVVPTYADIWAEPREGHFVVDAVRDDSPAATAMIQPGDRIISVDGMPVDKAVARFWSDLGLELTPERAGYAVRVLLAGRRDRPRRFAIESLGGEVRTLMLPSLYDLKQEQRPPLTSCKIGERIVIRFNNSLGDPATIAAFDNAVRSIADGHDLILDLRDTPSGGNTIVARAIMGWFVTDAHGYQIHNRPAEERATGIPRQWIEQVLPRDVGHSGELQTLLVGRWTGSMGEGLAIGFAEMGADVLGTQMAGLNGSVEDLRVGASNLFVKLPTERLLTVKGQPREEFVPRSIVREETC